MNGQPSLPLSLKLLKSINEIFNRIDWVLSGMTPEHWKRLVRKGQAPSPTCAANIADGIWQRIGGPEGEKNRREVLRRIQQLDSNAGLEELDEASLRG